MQNEIRPTSNQEGDQTTKSTTFEDLYWIFDIGDSTVKRFNLRPKVLRLWSESIEKGQIPQVDADGNPSQFLTLTDFDTYVRSKIPEKTIENVIKGARKPRE